MTTDDDVDRRIQDYLASGPAELADRVLWAARAQIHTTRRRRTRFGWPEPWREFTMSQSSRLLLAGGGVLALVVAIGAGLLGTAGKGPGASAAPPTGSAVAPSLSPSASTATATPTDAVRVPIYPDQTATPLTAAWTGSGGLATKLGVPEVGPDGRLWLASSVDNAFRILTPDGKLSETWGSPGSADGQFNFSVGGDNGGAIAFAPDGGFWVADTGNFRVQRFDRDRRFLSQWGRFGSGEGEFSYPLDIAVDAIGTVYVADDGRHDIQLFTSDGRYLRSVAPAQFVSANGEGFAMTNVLPDGRPGVVEYKPDGTYQGGMDMPELLPNPLGTTRDADHNIYVVGLLQNENLGRLIRFADTGAVLNVWDAAGLAVAVSPAGDRAYVLKADDATVARYDLAPPP